MKKALLAITLALAGVASAFAVSKPDFHYADIADRLRADCAAGTLKFDLNAKDLDGHTALYYAIDHNDLELVKAFVKHKAKVNRPCDDDGEYPLAVASGNIPAVSILLDCGADPAKRTADGTTANGIIEKNRQSDYDGFVYDDMKELLDSRATGDRSCLSIPKGTKIERRGTQVIYSADDSVSRHLGPHGMRPDEDAALCGYAPRWHYGAL